MTLQSHLALFCFVIFVYGMYLMSQLMVPENILIEARARELYISEKAYELCDNWNSRDGEKK